MDQSKHIEDRLESLISSLDVWLWETDTKGNYTYSSPQIEPILDYSIEEVLQFTFADLFPSTERKVANKNLSQLIEKQIPFENKKIYKQGKNGNLVLFESSGSPYYDPAGKFAGYRGLDRYITSKHADCHAFSLPSKLLESIEEPLMISESDGKIVYINPSFTKLFGYTPIESIGEHVSILFPPLTTSRPSLQDFPPELTEIEGSHGIRKRKNKEGDMFDVLVRSRIFQATEGEMPQTINQYQDTSKFDVVQISIEQTLRNEVILEQSQLLANVGGWELDIATDTLFWTAETYRIFETTPEEFDPSVDASLDLCLPKSKANLETAIRAATTDGKNYDLTLEMLTTKGRKIHVHTICEATIEDGRVSKLVGSVQDITQAVKKQRHLQLVLEQHKLALEAANLGQWSLDIEDQKLEWNDTQFKIYGESLEEFDGNPDTYMNMTHADDLPKMYQWRASLLKGETLKNKIYKIVTRNGDTRILQGSATPIKNLNGKIVKWVGINRDITESEQNKAQTVSLANDLQESLHGTLSLAMNLSTLRDPYTAGHEARVGIIAGEIGKVMGLSPREIEGLIGCGKLHDVGKFTIPLEILSKPGKLTLTEMTMVKEHCQAGYDVLINTKFPWPVAEVALQHHERIDGSGYPQGLKGNEIILEARIMAVADVVEAMASHRPYRGQVGIEKALEEIEQGSGIIYDADVANACIKLFRESAFKIPPSPE